MTTPTKDVNFCVRLDSRLKKDAEELFGEIGLSLGSALNIFLRQSVRLQGFPFQVGLNSSLGCRRQEDGSENAEPPSGEKKGE